MFLYIFYISCYILICFCDILLYFWSGAVLPTLTEPELTSMGISKLGWRRELLIAVRSLVKSPMDPHEGYNETYAKYSNLRYIEHRLQLKGVVFLDIS